MTIRFVMIGNHPMIHADTRGELEHSGTDLVIVGKVVGIEGAVTACHELKPDVALLDVHLPGGRRGGGAEVSARYQDIEGLCFLALSVSDSPEDAVQITRSGTRNYMTKSTSTPELVEAVQRVASGNIVFSPRLVGFIPDAFGTGQVAIGGNELDLLSAREQEVMRLIARGYTYKKVGNELLISVKAMEAHVSAVLRGLQLSNHSELARWAMQGHVV